MGFFGQLVLALVAGGGGGYVTHALLQRSRLKEQLRTAYVEFLAAIELVDRVRMKMLGSKEDEDRLSGELERIGKEMPKNQEELEAMTFELRALTEQRVETLQELGRYNDEFFDTRGQLSRAGNVLRLLEGDGKFYRRVKHLRRLVAKVVMAESKAAGMTASEEVNCDTESLVDEVRKDHPRLAVVKSERPEWG